MPRRKWQRYFMASGYFVTCSSDADLVVRAQNGQKTFHLEKDVETVVAIQNNVKLYMKNIHSEAKRTKIIFRSTSENYTMQFQFIPPSVVTQEHELEFGMGSFY